MINWKMTKGLEFSFILKMSYRNENYQIMSYSDMKNIKLFIHKSNLHDDGKADWGSTVAEPEAGLRDGPVV